MTVISSTAIVELIARLEKATGPSLELDMAIALMLHPKGSWSDWPRFTLSIDAALTLVPEGSNLEQLGQLMCLSKDGKAIWQARVRLRTLPNIFDRGKRGDRLESSGFMPTPAIALCIAALRARAAVEERK